MDDQTKDSTALSPEQRQRLARQRRLASLRFSEPTFQSQGANDVSAIEPEPLGSEELSQVENIVAGKDLPNRKEMQFSLFFFSADEAEMTENKYDLVLEASKFADQYGFTAVWTPERHFSRFGGLYPNPSVLSAAIAMITKRIQIRAGSVVLPIHHPVRVVEEWSIVDNLSKGRVGLSFASGWSPDDFMLSTNAYDERHEALFQSIQAVRKLWQGENLRFKDSTGRDIEICVYPKPVQPQIPIWITSSRSVDTCIKAGEIGANLLTALLNLTIEEIEQHIQQYRLSLETHGYGSDQGHVTLMLHTFVGDNIDTVKEKVRAPLSQYLRTYLGSIEHLVKRLNIPIDPSQLTEEDKESLAVMGFERYFTTSGLFGTPASCLAIVDRLRAIGVDEIACLIDFGMDYESTLDNLRHLHQLKELCNGRYI